MSNSIPDCLATARPPRSARRAQQLGIDNSPNKLGPPVLAQQQPVQVGIRFAHDSKSQMAMILTLGPNTIPVPMTPDGWDELAAAGDSIADQLRAILAAGPAPEPAVEYGPEDQAETGRLRIESVVTTYGKAVVSRPMMASLFRHAEHARNWARKHHLDLEADVETGSVTFSPAPLEPLQSAPPLMAWERPYIMPALAGGAP